MKGVARDELKARRLKWSGLRQEDTLGKRGEDRGGVVVKSGVETTGVMTSETWAFRGPLREDTVLRGKRRGPGESEVGRLFV